MEAPLEPSVLVSSLKGLRLQDRKVQGSVELLLKAWCATLPLEAGWCLARYTRQGRFCFVPLCGRAYRVRRSWESRQGLERKVECSGGLGAFSGPAGAFIAESQNMIYICDLHMHPRAQMYMFAHTFTYIHVHFVYIYACTYIHILDACMY